MTTRHIFARGLRALAFVLSLAALVACDSGDGDGDGDGDGGTAGRDRNVTAIWGEVVRMDGIGLPGVAVISGSASATTDSNGRFELNVAAGDAVLTFEKTGFLKQIEKVTVASGKATAVEVTMRPVAVPVALDMSAGGTATGERGAALIAPVGSLIDSGGNVVTGAVDVHLTPFDPSKPEELAALPGDLVAETETGEDVILESFGVLDVTVTQNGAELDVAAGQTVSIRIPIPEGSQNPPDTIPIWSFDEEQGIWKEEGVGTFNAAAGVYEAEIGHFSYWNADIVAEATCIKGVVKDESGNSVGGARVLASGVDYVGTSTATANPQGEFCAAVRKNSRVRISASDGVGGLVQREVDSGPEDTAVPPECDDPRCLDVGEFVIDTLTCDEVGNPFAGTCADGLSSLLTCFNPQGPCVIKGGATSSTMIEWENGAKMEVSLTSGNSEIDGEYIGPSGNSCGTFRSSTTPATTGEDLQFELTNPAGEVYAFTQDSDTGDQTIRCPNGEEVTMTREQMDAWQVCGNTDANETCTFEGEMPSNGGGGDIPSTCSNDSDCAIAGADLVCCDYMGTSVCLDRQTCDAVSGAASGCADGCPSGQECCNIAAGYSTCVPTGTCPQ